MTNKGAPSLHAILGEVFGYTAFRGEQQAIIEHLTQGQDALVLMPTGAGKSLCYQLPAIARHRLGLGLTLVISPLIALMQDQVSALEELGIHAAFLNSTLNLETTQRIERELLSGRLVLLYAAPERIMTPRFQGMLTSLYERGLLSLIAIDEAHCVSQWGHDFREEYLSLGALHDHFPPVPRIALTATADDITRQDMIERLQLQAAKCFISSFDRPNLSYRILEKSQPRMQLLSFLRTEHVGEAGIIYCQSRKKVEDTADWLNQAGFTALPYHAGLDASVRQHNQARFLREDGLIMVATIAFGMGIDKPDVRFVAHLDLPKNIESYYQETGRAGRDGGPADAWMVYGLADVVNQRRMIDESPAHDDFKRVQRKKLDALLALAEAHDCRRARLLAYFGESSPSCRPYQLLCDNCRQPPATWNATEAARKALSCIYRFWQQDKQSFGAGHLIDVLRGKQTPKVEQYAHQHLSTFAIGANMSEVQWRTVLRQLVALGYITTTGEFHTLTLTEQARELLKGHLELHVRANVASPRQPPQRSTESASRAPNQRLAALDAGQQARFLALKTWRADIAKKHDLPAYLVFHDTTLIDMACLQPSSLADLGTISGVGSKKLQAYGADILKVLQQTQP